MEIHDGITAVDLQYGMDQGPRYLRCAAHDYYCEASVVHPQIWRWVCYWNKHVLMERTRSSPTPVSSWSGAPYHQHESPTIHRQYRLCTGWSDYHRSQVSRQQQPSDLILLIRIKHGLSINDLMLIPWLEHWDLTAYPRQYCQLPYNTGCRFAVSIQSYYRFCRNMLARHPNQQESEVSCSIFLKIIHST